MAAVFSFIYELVKSPLGLPIEPLWEYIILLGVNAAAYAIAWKASDGGIFGSGIHWAVRIVAFAVIWAITYAIIWIAKMLVAHWAIVLCILGGIILAAVLIAVLRKNKKKTV